MADTPPKPDDENAEYVPPKPLEPELDADVFDFSGGDAPSVESPDLDENGNPLPPASPLEFLERQLAAVEAERDDMKDKMVRALAEGENVRKRAMRDREEGEKYGGVRLARDLLAVYDNLDRALQAADEKVRTDAPDFIAGVELTQRELLNAFAKHKIAPVTPELGEKFDPNRHQAMFESPAPGAANNTIIQVMQPGFTISDRLLRAAMVGVAKNPAGAAAPAAANDAGTANADGGEKKTDAQPDATTKPDSDPEQPT